MIFHKHQWLLHNIKVGRTYYDEISTYFNLLCLKCGKTTCEERRVELKLKEALLVANASKWYYEGDGSQFAKKS